MEETKIVLAEATVHLPGGLVPGGVYRVDANSDYVRDCIDAGYLVLVDTEPVLTATAAVPTAAEDETVVAELEGLDAE